MCPGRPKWTTQPAPGMTSDAEGVNVSVHQEVWTEIVKVEGLGYVDCINIVVGALTGSHETGIRVKCDGKTAFSHTYENVKDWGCNPSSPPIALLQYEEDGGCRLLLSVRFGFRREFLLQAYTEEVVQAVSATVTHSLME